MISKKSRPRNQADFSNGVPVDRSGDRAIDPTENVIALVESEARAASQLRLADIKYNDSQHAHLKEMASLRAINSEILRTSDLDRQEKTRQVDVLASATSAATLATAVQTLATSNDRNAEMIRNQLNADRTALAKQVQDTAATLSTQTDALMRDVNNRIGELQKSSYQGVGKSSVSDPMMTEFVTEMRTLVKAQASGGGKSEGVGDAFRMISLGLGILLTLIAIGTFVFVTQRQSNSTPQIIYSPPPTTLSPVR